MKKKLGLIAAAILSLAFCFYLSGCGKGVSSEAVESLSGKWEINSVESEDEAQQTSAADASLMRQMGLSVTLELNEDGTASMDVFGEVSEGEWTAKEANSGVLSIKDQKVNIELDENGLLRLSQNGAVLVFQRPTSDSPKTTDGSEVEKTKEEAESKAQEEAAKKADSESESTDESSDPSVASGEQQVVDNSGYQDTTSGYGGDSYSGGAYVEETNSATTSQ